MDSRGSPSLDAPIGRRELLRLLAGTSSALLTGCALTSTGRARRGTGIPNWTGLQQSVQGRVVPLGAADYESSRRGMLWNGLKPERFPDAIVHVGAESDVGEAIRFARQHNLKVAVRGGGHHWHNPALRQGGLLLNLSGLNRLEVDAQNRTAMVQPGVTGTMLMASLAPLGLAFPVGHEGRVGLSGFLLNGGLGWNYRVWGPSCASVDAVDLVDARGDSIRADRSHNEDLFWAARGAGPGFFGVVTRFHLKLYQLPQAILSSSLQCGIEDIDKVAAWMPRLVRSVPANVEWGCRGVVNRDNSRTLNIGATVFANSLADARSALGAFEAAPIGVTVRAKSLYEQRSPEDMFGPRSNGALRVLRCRGESVWSNASPEKVLSREGGAILAAPSRPAQTVFCGLGILWYPPDPDGPPLPDMAFSMKGSIYAGPYALWNDAAQDSVHLAWTRNAMTDLEPLKVGYWVGDADLTVAADRAKQCFSPSAWDRLVRLKRKYDPEDVFFSYLQ